MTARRPPDPTANPYLLRQYPAITKLGAVLLALAALAGCGYRVSGRADLLPKRIKTIAIPAFGNATTRYKLTDRLPAAFTREFIGRTRYEVVPDVENADAVLEGSVLNYMYYPTLSFNGRASEVQLIVILSLTLRDRSNGQVLFTRPSIDFKERYEVSIDPRAYFEESDAALDRLSRDVARSMLSAILEQF